MHKTSRKCTLSFSTMRLSRFIRGSLASLIIVVLTVSGPSRVNTSSCQLFIPNCPKGLPNGFQGCKKYIYSFESNQNIYAIPRPSHPINKHNLKIKGEVHIDVNSECNELSLTIPNWTSTLPQGESSDPELLQTGFEKPLIFNYAENGSINNIQIPDGEPIWKVNVQRTLLSLFQTHSGPDVENQLNSNKVSYKDVREDDTFGSCLTRYYFWPDNSISKLKIEPSCTHRHAGSVHKSQKDFHQTHRNPFDTLPISNHTHEPIKSHQDLTQRYLFPPYNLDQDDSFHIRNIAMQQVNSLATQALACSQTFNPNTKTLSKVICQEFQVQFMNGKLWSFVDTSTTMQFIRVENSPPKIPEKSSDFKTSSLLFDHNEEKPSKETKIFINPIITMEICKLVQIINSPLPESLKFLKSSSKLKKILKSLSSQQISEIYQFLKNSTLNCETANREKQIEFFLETLANSLTDDSVEFIIEESLKNGTIPQKIIHDFLYNLAFMTAPGERSIKSVELLLNKNEKADFNQEKLLLASSGFLRMYQAQPNPDRILLSKLKSTIYQKITQNPHGLSKLTLLEAHRNFNELLDNDFTCSSTNYPDDFERLRCLSCSTITDDSYRDLLDSKLRVFLQNRNAPADLRILAYLALNERLYGETLTVVKAIVDNADEDGELKNFINLSPEFYEDHVTPPPPETATTLTVEESEEKHIKSALKKALEQLRENENRAPRIKLQSQTFHLPNLEADVHLVFKEKSKLPRLVRLEANMNKGSRVYKLLEVELFFTNSMEFQLIIRQYGIAIYTKTISTNAENLSSLFYQKNIESILPDLIHLGSITLQKLQQDQNFEFLKFNSQFDELISQSSPTLSGFPLKNNLKKEAFLLARFITTGLNNLKDNYRNNNQIDASASLLVVLAGKKDESSVLSIGGNTEVGFECFESAEAAGNVTLGLITNPGDNSLSFSLKFPFKSTKQSVNDVDIGILSQDIELITEGTPDSIPVIRKSNVNVMESLYSSSDIWHYITPIPVKNWYLTISHSDQDSANKSFSLLLQPFPASQSNTIKVKASLLNNHEKGHEAFIDIQSPFKNLSASWAFVKEENSKFNQTMSTSVIYDTQQFSAIGYLQKIPFSETNTEVVCDYPFCSLFKQYELGINAKTSIKGYEEINLLQFDLTYQDRDANAIDFVIQSHGVHPYFNSKIQAHFQRLLIESSNQEEHNATTKLLAEYPWPYYGNFYNISLQAQNDLVGMFRTNLSIPVPHVTLPVEEDSGSVKPGVLIAEYFETPTDTEPKDWINLTWWTYENIRQLNNPDKAVLSQFVLDFVLKSSKYPVVGLHNSIEELKEGGQETGLMDKMTFLHKIYFIDNPKVNFILKGKYKCKGNHFRQLFMDLIQREKRSSLLQKDIEMEHEITVESNGKPLKTLKFDLVRKENSLKLLQIIRTKYDYEKRENKGREEINSISWNATNKDTSSLEIQITHFGHVHFAKHSLAKISPNTWQLESSGGIEDGPTARISGSIYTNYESLNDIAGADLILVKGSIENPLKKLGIKYQRANPEDCQCKNYSLAIVDQLSSQNIMETYIQGTSDKRIKALLFLKDFLKSELEVVGGQINFNIILIPKALEANGRINIYPYVNYQTLLEITTNVNWTDKSQGSKVVTGQFISNSKVFKHFLGGLSKTTIYIDEKLHYDLHLLLTSEIRSTRNPIVFIYLTYPNGQKSGLNISTAFSLNYGQESMEEDELNNQGLIDPSSVPQKYFEWSLQFDHRENPEPLIIDLSVKVFRAVIPFYKEFMKEGKSVQIFNENKIKANLTVSQVDTVYPGPVTFYWYSELVRGLNSTIEEGVQPWDNKTHDLDGKIQLDTVRGNCLEILYRIKIEDESKYTKPMSRSIGIYAEASETRKIDINAEFLRLTDENSDDFEELRYNLRFLGPSPVKPYNELELKVGQHCTYSNNSNAPDGSHMSRSLSSFLVNANNSTSYFYNDLRNFYQPNIFSVSNIFTSKIHPLNTSQLDINLNSYTTVGELEGITEFLYLETQSDMKVERTDNPSEPLVTSLSSNISFLATSLKYPRQVLELKMIQVNDQNEFVAADPEWVSNAKYEKSVLVSVGSDSLLGNNKDLKCGSKSSSLSLLEGSNLPPDQEHLQDFLENKLYCNKQSTCSSCSQQKSDGIISLKYNEETFEILWKNTTCNKEQLNSPSFLMGINFSDKLCNKLLELTPKCLTQGPHTCPKIIQRDNLEEPMKDLLRKSIAYGTTFIYWTYWLLEPFHA